MPKLKTVYICSSCGYESPKWAGQCNQCDEWNSFVEDVIDKSASKAKKSSTVKLSKVGVRKLSELDHKAETRFTTGIGEFDRVLGGGIVKGSVTLLGGEPGIGKSTVTLQILDGLKELDSVFYVAGEESVGQISLRAKRLGVKLTNVHFVESYVLEEVLALVEKQEPNFIVVDSIQVMRSLDSSSMAGGINQIRITADRIIDVAKRLGIPTLIIGHVTKDGELAGPKVLEHLVDTVMYIEGNRLNQFRFLKPIKNRFGPTDEVGIFRMTSEGLLEVPDPAAAFIEDRDKLMIGTTLSCTTEGNRAFLVEIQALTSASAFGYPKRSATGFDTNRLIMIIAVLQKYYGVDLSNQDVFVNVSGGFKIKDTASDLAVMKAIVSSFKKEQLKLDTVYVGEVSLAGSVKSVAYQDLREKEAKRLKFKVNTKL